MGRNIFVLEEKVLLNFTVPLIIIIYFFISSTSAPQNKSKRRALFSECVVLMRGCSGTDEYQAGKEISQYTHYIKQDYTTA